MGMHMYMHMQQNLHLPGPFTDATTVCVTTLGDAVNVTVLVSVTLSVTVCVTVRGEELVIMGGRG